MKKLLLAMTCLVCFSSFALADTVDDAISWMYDNGLTIHNNKADFKATKWLRRDEAAKFYVNFSKLLGNTGYVKTASQCTFSDINNSRSDLKDIVVESCRLWLFQGSKWKFFPQNQLTNAQAIAVLGRILMIAEDNTLSGHRADNYYKRESDLNILKNVSMDKKDSIVNRGNVGIIIYNANKVNNEVKLIINRNCAKEGEITQRLWDNPKYCCEWLEWYQSPDLPDWIWIELLCYNKTKWEPSCIIDWHRLEWLYYPNGDLLKQVYCN